MFEHLRGFKEAKYNSEETPEEAGRRWSHLVSVVLFRIVWSSDHHSSCCSQFPHSVRLDNKQTHHALCDVTFTVWHVHQPSAEQVMCWGTLTSSEPLTVILLLTVMMCWAIWESFKMDKTSVYQWELLPRWNLLCPQRSWNSPSLFPLLVLGLLWFCVFGPKSSCAALCCK